MRVFREEEVGYWKGRRGSCILEGKVCEIRVNETGRSYRRVANVNMFNAVRDGQCVDRLEMKASQKQRLLLDTALQAVACADWTYVFEPQDCLVSFCFFELLSRSALHFWNRIITQR
jgi:hypothetical protein